jgi:hypothetical protein
MSTIVRNYPHRRAAIVEIHATETRWHGHYRFSTEGMSPDAVRSKHDAILVHHQAKSARHEGFNRMDRMIDGFHVHGLAIVEQGTDVRLILRVTAPDGSILNLDRVAPTVADLPADSQIATIVRDAATVWIGRDDAADEHVADVKRVLGLQ